MSGSVGLLQECPSAIFLPISMISAVPPFTQVALKMY